MIERINKIKNYLILALFIFRVSNFNMVEVSQDGTYLTQFEIIIKKEMTFFILNYNLVFFLLRKTTWGKNAKIIQSIIYIGPI